MGGGKGGGGGWDGGGGEGGGGGGFGGDTHNRQGKKKRCGDRLEGVQLGRGTAWKGCSLEGVQLGVGALVVKVSAAAHALGPRLFDLVQTSLCPRSPLSARR